MAIVVSNKQNEHKFVQGTLRPVIPVSAATTLTDAQSGSIISITNAAALADAYAITLPAPTVAAGMQFYFVLATAGLGGTTITSNAVNMRFKGLANAAQVVSVACTSVAIAPVAVTGDFVEMYSNGTNWFATGISQVAVGFVTA